MRSEKLNDLIKTLPESPGVYLMRDAQGKVIYVGKAKVLKNRVSSYFRGAHELKVQAMVARVDHFETIITDTEMEALVLENHLIKEYKPQYNILLKDDKTYPYLKVTLGEKFPRVLKVRKVLKDKGRYFGPYTSALVVNETLDIIRSSFALRTCTRDIPRSIERGERPCLNLYIHRCVGPCTGNVSEEEYDVIVQDVIAFLSGKSTELVDRLTERMHQAADRRDYESAARLRDNIQSVKTLLERQKIESRFEADQDYVAMSREEQLSCIQVFFVRGGKVAGREHFFLPDTQGESQEAILSAFLKQFYLGVNYIPAEILCDVSFEDQALLQRWLSEKRGHKCQITVPKRGNKRQLLDLVQKNAVQALEQNLSQKRARLERTVGVMAELQSFLNLPHTPRRVEAFDISNIQGVDSVGGQVVFTDGYKDRKAYRRYRIKSVEGPNDYASMEEILNRRLSHEDLPDLILMDGGKGQVSVAAKVLAEKNLSIPVLGMVKDDRHRTFGLVTQDNQTIELPRHSLLYKFIAQVQDEVHRFAISYHRSLRGKALEKSELDDIKGIGRTRKMALITHYKSIGRIKEAAVEQLSAVPGMNKSAAQAVYAHFHPERSPDDLRRD